MLFKRIVLVLTVLCNVYCADPDVLFISGWYKTRKRGEKKNVYNVSSIGPDLFPNTAVYLKISSVIPVLREGSVNNLEILKDLTVSSSGIIDIQPGAFKNVQQLSKLNLKENAIQHIRKGIFNSLNLTTIFLNKNEISVIDSDAFDDMPYLSRIKLNFNQISMWDSKWFKRTPSLTVVLFRRNSIEEIPNDALVNLIKFNSTEQKTDLKIYFSKNKISKIHPDAFRGVKKLLHLYLDRNKLTEINSNIFSGMEQIHILNLAKNNLTSISKDLFSTLKLIKTLDLSANHKLHCVPVSVARVVKFINLENINSLNCTCTKELRKNVKLSTSELSCDD